MRITSAFDGVAFSTGVSTGTSNISISAANLIQTSAVFVISGTPSITINNPQSFNYVLQPVGPSCIGGAVNFQGAITVNPISFGSHIATSGAENQISCDGSPISTIQYDLVGASLAIPSGATPAWLQHNIVGGVLSIDGTPDLDIKVEQSFPYSYSLGGNFFGCGVASATVSGKITLRPKDHLTLSSDPQTINQDICINEEIIDIVYEFSGSANAMAFNQPLGLPDGVEGQYTPRQQVSEITIGNGITGIISETYTVYIGSTPYVYIAPLGTNADTVGDELAQKIDGDNDVSANYDPATNKITVTAAVADQSFGIFVPDQSSNSVEINDPLVATSPGIFRISGEPSNAVIPGSYTYTLTTPGILCTQIM